jgi:hypothetical protein
LREKPTPKCISPKKRWHTTFGKFNTNVRHSYLL